MFIPNSQHFKLYLKIIFYIFLPYLLFISCSTSTEPVDKSIYVTEINGQVILENQTEYSNALIYVDSLYRGVSSDSAGNYNLIFTEEDSIYNGIFEIYYFLNDYYADTAKFALEHGKVLLDSLDVDGEGNIATKYLIQIVKVEGFTDKYEYSVGDSVTFTLRITNVSEKQVKIRINSCIIPLSSGIILYNDKYTPSFSLSGFIDIISTECVAFLKHNDFYEGTVRYKIANQPQLNPDEYIVYSGFFINNRTLNHLESTFYKYIVEEWYKIHRGLSPKLDFFPNKWELPHIRIVE